MTIIEQRDQAVTETVGRVRLIEQQHGVNYDALGKIRDELIDQIGRASCRERV